MKITRNDLRGTAVVAFDLSNSDDAAFKAWMAECKKPGVGMYDAAERVLKRKRGKVTVRNSPCECEDEHDL